MRATFPSQTAVAPATTHAHRSSDAERYYIGRRPDATEVYVITGPEVAPLEHPRYRSNARFDWGGATAGALELAFGLLARSTDSRPPDLICETFRADVVARLDHAGFVLTDGEIALWLLSAFHDDTAAADPSRDRGRGLRVWAARWLHRRRRRR